MSPDSAVLFSSVIGFARAPQGAMRCENLPPKQLMSAESARELPEPAGRARSSRAACRSGPRQAKPARSRGTRSSPLQRVRHPPQRRHRHATADPHAIAARKLRSRSSRLIAAPAAQPVGPASPAPAPDAAPMALRPRRHTACAKQTPDWRSRHTAAPQPKPMLPAPMTPPRSPA